MQVSFFIFAGCAANDFYTNEVLCRDVQYIGLGLILLTNIVATSSIAVTAWYDAIGHFASLWPSFCAGDIDDS